MNTTFPQRIAWVAAWLLVTTSLALAAEPQKPYILGSESQAEFAAAVQSTKEKLTAAGFRIVGEYIPIDDAHILVFTSEELLRVSAASQYGGFAAAQRASVVKRNDRVQVAYTNPIYMAYAYRLTSDLGNVAQRLAEALGSQTAFGAKRGLSPEELREYHYTFGMEYFDEPYELAQYRSHNAALAAVEEHLNSNDVGVRPLYRLTIPGKREVIFGVAMKAPDPNSIHKYMDDAFQMSVVDHGEYSQIGYLPYEVMVIGNRVVALHMRFRMAVNFPSLRMLGKNSFMTIRPSPEHIGRALTIAVGGQPPPAEEF